MGEVAAINRPSDGNIKLSESEPSPSAERALLRRRSWETEPEIEVETHTLEPENEQCPDVQIATPNTREKEQTPNSGAEYEFAPPGRSCNDNKHTYAEQKFAKATSNNDSKLETSAKFEPHSLLQKSNAAATECVETDYKADGSSK